MKKIFIVLGLVGLIHLTLGSKPSVGSSNYNDGIVKEKSSGLYAPLFTELDGNLFIAIKGKEAFTIDDGDVLEFEFNKKQKLPSFHINDINQDLIDTGQADLFVMVHHDLALKLKSHKVEMIHITHNGVIHTIQVNRFWIPDEYL